MDLILLFLLSLSCWTAATRYTWSNKPQILVSSLDIEDGESVTVSCTVPIEYLGGNCRLFRGSPNTPFRLRTASSYVCDFHLTSEDLLGNKSAGAKISIWCDYRIQDFTSEASDEMRIVIWGTRPSPSLSISHRFLTPDDIIEVTCSPPASHVYECHFYKDQYQFAHGPCSRNMTGRDFAIWEKPALLLPVNLTCTYDPERGRHIRSKNSNHQLLFVVDVSRVTSSVDCVLSISDDELEAFRGDRWSTVGANGTTVTVQVTNSSLTLNETCNHSEQNRVNQ